MSAWTVAAVLCLAPCFAACEPDDGGDEARWEHVFTELPAALLGVWGSSATDVWVVGADAGEGPWVLRFDGDSWKRKTTGHTGTLWSVSGQSAARVWMAGESGLVLRYDRASDAFTKIGGVPANVTLYGIFETPNGEVWTVGGNGQGGRIFSMGSPNGSTFSEEALPEEAATGRFFKVWGRTSSDLWVVGAGGDVLYRDTGGWQAFGAPGAGRLAAVHGNASFALAVGGFANGLVVSLGPDGVTDTTPPNVSPLNGVWVDTDGSVVAVGTGGAVLERRGSVWRTPTGVPSSLDDYQAVYVDPDGGIWAVGGFLLVEPQRRGMLLHYGLPVSNVIK